MRKHTSSDEGDDRVPHDLTLKERQDSKTFMVPRGRTNQVHVNTNKEERL